MEMSRKLEQSLSPNTNHVVYENKKYLKIIHLGSEPEENFELLFKIEHWYIVINKIKIVFTC